MQNTKVGVRRDVITWLKRFQHVFKALVLHNWIWPHVCSYKHTDSICDGFQIVQQRGCLNAAVISGCWAAFIFTPVSETPGWCRFKCVAMLDVFPLSHGFPVPQYLHTVTVLSTDLFPSSLYLTGKTKCSHTGDLNDAGRSSSSGPLLAMTTLHCVEWTCAQLFFLINQSTDHVCAEPKILIQTDHGSKMIRCTTTKYHPSAPCTTPCGEIICCFTSKMDLNTS